MQDYLRSSKYAHIEQHIIDQMKYTKDTTWETSTLIDTIEFSIEHEIEYLVKGLVKIVKKNDMKGREKVWYNVIYEQFNTNDHFSKLKLNLECMMSRTACTFMMNNIAKRYYLLTEN
jgi:hypothetical protein